MLVLPVYSSLSASITNPRKHRAITLISMYQHFDGKDCRQNRRADIVACLA